MATIAYFEGIWEYDDKTRIFRTINNQLIFVTKFEDGIVTIDPLPGDHIDSVIENVVGCFDESSNFKEQLFIAFPDKVNDDFNGIQFNFNGVTILVKEGNADKDKIYAEWEAGMNANAEKARLEWEAYTKTPEYRAKRAKELKKLTRREAVQKDVLLVDQKTHLRFKDKEAAKQWRRFVRVNSKEPYGNAVITYARYWAKYMQHLMKKHDKMVSEVADKASHAADIEGVTGFMYGCAVNMLACCWKYGEELRIWHNKQYGQEEKDGVVNPAMITISMD